MSLKLVELQVALPRTQDLGKMQEELQQRSRHIQDHLASVQHKEEIEKRQQVNKYDKTAKNKLQNDGHNSNGAAYQRKNQKQNKKGNHHEESPHPYKGNIIDIEG